jgi:hypothetical protein
MEKDGNRLHYTQARHAYLYNKIRKRFTELLVKLFECEKDNLAILTKYMHNRLTSNTLQTDLE